MGIPAFYRWLVDRYPLAVADVVEESPPFINGVQLPLDLSQPNPNGLEFDNLYLDMNGIIHPCFHPEGQPAPKSYEEVFKAVFKYIDRVFSIVRPRKLLYMAIDGVAPRAKMNQQRARRFRAAKDAADAAAGEERLRNVFEAEGKKLSVLQLQSNSLDSNVITPGTQFMASLSSALQYYIHLRINTDAGWRGIKVILSDANAVGEGEHKIMSYIRLQRNLPGFDSNTRHCLYGLDADLIMLALATHEVHFSILREDVRKVRNNTEDPQIRKCSTQRGQLNGDQGLMLGEVGTEEVNDYISRQQFQFFNVWVLRDYLEHDMKIPNTTGKADLERLMDDFVFICLFVGNDFLPHVPSLEISEGAIDLLMTVYKKEFVQMGSYLTDSFKVNLKRVEHFIQAVGLHENAIFRRRTQVQKERGTRQGFSKAKRGSGEAQNLRLVKRHKSETFWSSIDPIPNSTHSSSPSSIAKESQSFVNSARHDGANVAVDNIKLGEEGWKERFYTEKFEAHTEDERDKIRKHAVLKYIEGMCWVMHYYYEGVCSWQWFYPYHYAPFASDFYDLEHFEIHFTLGKPFKPFDQLMGVLPAASAHALPSYYRELMTDSSSPILDFYPHDFELDMNGKRHEWQAICKLPFIEESRLLAEIAKVEHTLTDEEKHRNSLGMDMLFAHISHPLAAEVVIFYERNKDHPKLAKAKVKRRIDPICSGGMNGFMYISDKPVWPLEIYSSIGDMEKITINKVISVFYKNPTAHPHIPRPPEGVVMPRMSVRKEDVLPAPVLWHEKLAVLGRIHSERPVPNSISGSCLAKLAHQLVLEYYVDKKKQSAQPAALNGLTDIDVPSCSTQLTSKKANKEKKLDNVHSVNEPIPEKREADAAATKSGKRRKIRAADEGRQESMEPSVLTEHIAMNVPSCPTQKSLKETIIPEMKESEAVAIKAGKRNRKRRVACEKGDELVEPAVLDRCNALDAPSCPTGPDLEVTTHEDKMECESCVNVTQPEKKRSDATDTKLHKKKHRHRVSGEDKEENLETAVQDGHAATDAPSFRIQRSSKETVHDKRLDDESCLNATKPEKKRK